MLLVDDDAEVLLLLLLVPPMGGRCTDGEDVDDDDEVLEALLLLGSSVMTRGDGPKYNGLAALGVYVDRRAPKRGCWYRGLPVALREGGWQTIPCVLETEDPSLYVTFNILVRQYSFFFFRPLLL